MHGRFHGVLRFRTDRGANGTPHLRGRVPTQQMVPHQITSHLTARHAAVVPVAVGHVIELERHLAAVGDRTRRRVRAALAAGQLSAWRINLNKPRVFSIYKFSSLPLAISAATAIASWASSSSDDGGAAASRGRGPAFCFTPRGRRSRGSWRALRYDARGAAVVHRACDARGAGFVSTSADASLQLCSPVAGARAAARVTAARWGRGFGEARRQASTRFGRGEAARGPCIHRVDRRNFGARTLNARRAL